MKTLTSNEKTQEIEAIFDFDYLSNIIEDYEVESEDGQARIRIVGNNVCITVYDVDRFEGNRTISFYMFKECPDVYKKIDASYREIIKNYSTNNDFYDMWNAIKTVMNDSYLITEEVFTS